MKDTSFPVFVIGGSVAIVLPAATALVYTAGSTNLVSAVSTSILAANLNRKSLEIFNPVGTTPVFLGFGGAAVANVGPAIGQVQSWSHDIENNLGVCQQEIRGIQSSGVAVVVTWVEGV